MPRYLLASALLLLVPLAPSAQPRALEAGDPAPEFALPGSDGKVHRLSDYKGKQAVVLVWFAKAHSAG